jgi:hypothetical protein
VDTHAESHNRHAPTSYIGGSGPFTATGTVEHFTDLAGAIATLRTGPALAVPDLPLLHPNTFAALRTEQDTMGRFYVAADPSQTQVEQIWGVEVLQSTAFTAGEGVLLDTTLVGRVAVREALALRIGYAGSDFTNNIIRTVCEERLNFAVERPAAIVRCNRIARDRADAGQDHDREEMTGPGCGGNDTQAPSRRRPDHRVAASKRLRAGNLRGLELPRGVVSIAPCEGAVWIGLLRVRDRSPHLPGAKERRKPEILIEQRDRLARVAANLVSETDHLLPAMVVIQGTSRHVRTAPALLRHQGYEVLVVDGRPECRKSGVRRRGLDRDGRRRRNRRRRDSWRDTRLRWRRCGHGDR